MIRFILLCCSLTGLVGNVSLAGHPEQATHAGTPADPPIHIFQLSGGGGAEGYDEALAVACLEGIINRDGPHVYVLSPTKPKPA